MTALDDLVQEWSHQLAALLPGVRVTQVRGVVKLAVGILVAESCAITRVARVLPGRAGSNEKQGYRLLANPRIDPAVLWSRIRRGLLSAWANQPVLLVFDPTVHGGTDALQLLSVVEETRAVPVAWRIASQVRAWETGQAAVLGDLLDEVLADLPATAGPVTVLLDRGLQGSAMVAAVRARGGAVVLGMQVGEEATARVRVRGTDRSLAAFVRQVVTTPGQLWAGPVAVFKRQGWQAGWLTVWWDPAQRERLVVFSTRRGGMARVAEYARRMRVEATYADLKSRGLRLEQSRVRDPARVARLLVAVMLGYWMALAWGAHVVRDGGQGRVDRPGRRTMAMWRLGREAVLDLLRTGVVPPLPLDLGAEGPRWRWAIGP